MHIENPEETMLEIELYYILFTIQELNLLHFLFQSVMSWRIAY